MIGARSLLEDMIVRDRAALMTFDFADKSKVKAEVDRRELLRRVNRAIEDCDAALSLMDRGYSARERIRQLLNELRS